jgi:PAS domain S-box-containing protein
MLAPKRADEFVETALAAVRKQGWKRVLDRLPVPVYLTDAEGSVTYWNQACVDFAGRQPQLGHDRWCVTWELYTTTGKRLLHEDCPMAEAIRGRCEIRGEVAIALRPDGSRRAFTPYPTPLFDNAGNLTGAINLLIDVTEEQASALGEQAARCKRLALAIHNKADSEILAKLGDAYAATAAALRESQQTKTPPT